MNFLRKKNIRSQVAVIITLIIAVIFLLISVFINISKVSNIKTLTSQASDRAALSLASKISSISKSYWDALGGKEQSCEADWWTLFKLAIVALATIVSFFFIPNPVILLTGIGLFVSTAMTSGITKKFQDMSAYNAIREDALFQALWSIQSDDVELKNLKDDANNPRPGIFYDPALDPNDPNTPTYDLRENPRMLNAPKVGRFLAWYYTRRAPLIDDSVLRDAVDKFVNGSNPTVKDGIKKFVKIDRLTDWDPEHWKIKKLSFVVDGKRSRYPAGDYYVTCDSCPSWVYKASEDQVILTGLNEKDELAEDTFLNSKFDAGFGLCGLSIGFGLMNRLECDYKGVFAKGASNIVNTVEYANLKEDLREFLVRIKEVLNMPVSERIRGVTQWFPYFYSTADHRCDSRLTCHTTGDFNEDNKYDIYLRLERDRFYIQKWIDGLTKLDNEKIRPDIEPHHGSYCHQGRGDPLTDKEKQCYQELDECYCSTIMYDESGDSYTVCSGTGCIKPVTALWYGNYGTCAGSDPHKTHPVCESGDLYTTPPGWCFDLRPVVSPCVSNSDPCLPCGIPEENLPPIRTSYYYQGQYSWRPFIDGQYDSKSGPTELGQAIEILKELRDDLARFQMIIADLQRTIENLQTSEIINLRNEIVYAWKDKIPRNLNTNVQQYSHVARVKIINYPEELPYVSEGEKWNVDIPGIGIVDVPFTKCRTLHSYKGGFEIIASRYDQDQPSAFWNLRRRRNVSYVEYPVELVDKVVNDIQGNQNGLIDPDYKHNQDDIIDFYSITSSTEVHYGPEKSDIYIMSVDANGSGLSGGGAYNGGCASACSSDGIGPGGGSGGGGSGIK